MGRDDRELGADFAEDVALQLKYHWKRHFLIAALIWAVIIGVLMWATS